jgi:hypothetical protein
MIRQLAKNILPDVVNNFVQNLIDDSVSSRENAKEIEEWQKRNYIPPVPHAIKQQIIADFQQTYKLEHLIEIGMNEGKTIWTQRRRFERIIAIAPDKNIQASTREKFKDIKNVKIFYGKTLEMLEILAQQDYFKEACLFWIDLSNRTVELELLQEELSTIFATPVHHTILIGEAHRLGKNIDVMKEFIADIHANYTCEVEHDVLCIAKKQMSVPRSMDNVDPSTIES